MDESGKAAHSGSALIGNADMRLKNGSLIYPDRRRVALAPAYDLLSTIPYIPDELSHLAAKALLPERLVLDAAHETVALFHQYWQPDNVIAEL